MDAALGMDAPRMAPPPPLNASKSKPAPLGAIFSPLPFPPPLPPLPSPRKWAFEVKNSRGGSFKKNPLELVTYVVIRTTYR